MKSKKFAGRIVPDLQHCSGRDRDRRTPAVIVGIGIGDEHAESVVAAGEVEHDQIAGRGALRAGEVR
jgi:hypothetical protein